MYDHVLFAKNPISENSNQIQGGTITARSASPTQTISLSADHASRRGGRPAPRVVRSWCTMMGTRSESFSDEADDSERCMLGLSLEHGEDNNHFFTLVFKQGDTARAYRG